VFKLHCLMHIQAKFQVLTVNRFVVNQFSLGRHQLSTRSFLTSVQRHSFQFSLNPWPWQSWKEFGDSTSNPLGAVTMGVSMAACAALSWSAGAESDDLNPQPFGFTETRRSDEIVIASSIPASIKVTFKKKKVIDRSWGSAHDVSADTFKLLLKS
jgi:hypothetical protein